MVGLFFQEHLSILDDAICRRLIFLLCLSCTLQLFVNGYRILFRNPCKCFGHGLEGFLNISQPCTTLKMNKGWLELESDPGEDFRKKTQLNNVSLHIKPDRHLSHLKQLDKDTDSNVNETVKNVIVKCRAIIAHLMYLICLLSYSRTVYFAGGRFW